MSASDSCHTPPTATKARSAHGLPIVALCGNPNSGKTSLFNHLTGSHQHVANYAGVTVDLHEGTLRRNGSSFKVVDIPGLYSLSAASPDEEIARDLIVHGVGAAGRPDLVVQVVDGGRLERSLLLTLQLIDQGIPLVIALNMYDEIRKRGLMISPDKLGRALGVKVIPTVGNRGEGIAELTEAIITGFDGGSATPLKVHFDQDTESALQKIETICADNGKEISRGVAIGILTREPSATKELSAPVDAAVSHELGSLTPSVGGSWTDAVTHARYAAISKLLAGTAAPNGASEDRMTSRIDAALIHPIWGVPLFLMLLYGLFQLTFSLGAYPMDWINAGVTWLAASVKTVLPGLPGEVLGDGFISGAGMVLVFLPNILILLMGIHLLEDSGYMARAAFLMDRVMRLMGLHGKSFIPLLMGFGCNVPAMMASRTLESRRDRLLTMLLTPFMSCSARLPVYVMVTAALFPKHGGLVIFCLYVGGSIVAVALGRIFSKTLLRGKSAPFVMELPPYRWPTGKTTWTIFRFTTKIFLKRIGGAVALFATLIWFLANFPRPESGAAETAYNHESYIYQIGAVLDPMMKPLGFNVQMDVALVSGFIAKEVVVATMGVLFTGSSGTEKSTLVEELRRQIPGPEAGLAFLVFVLLYTPCLTTIVTLQREGKRWGWTLFSIIYQTGFAWGAAWVTYQIAIALA